ncbi:MAG: EamA family transporter [Clostridia bacterium]|nr:EamA family transporter [Clostridia bacterium]
MKRSIVLIVLAGLLWGTSGVFAHFLYPCGFAPLELVGCRALVSFLGMAGFALCRNRALFRVRLRELPLLLLVGLGIFATASLYYTAMAMTSVSTAVMLMYTAPVYVLFLSVLFLGERLSRLKLFSVALMLLGCCFVSGIIGDLRFDLFGLLAGAASGVTYALYNIFVKISVRHKNDPVSVSMYAFLAMTLAALPFIDFRAFGAHVAAAPARTVPLLIGIGIFTCVLPYLLYTLAMRELSAGTATALGIVEPMSASVYSFAFLGESLDLLAVLGIVLVLLSVYLLSRAEEGENTKEKTEENAA